ncbi:hypothetical protein GCM10027048_27510 [Hymenobacter coalescens]
MSHYNPGGWSATKLKVYAVLLALAVAGVALGQWMGWIDIDQRPAQNRPVEQLR